MADYELIGLNEAAPDLRAPTSADRGIIAGGVRVVGLAELDGGADINGSRITTVTDTNPLRQAVRVAMTAAASGSSGIRSLDNASLNMGTNSFTLHWEGALPDYTPVRVRLFYKLLSSVGYQLALEANGRLRIFLNAGTFDSTVSTGITDGSNAKITAVIVRESVSADGSITFYVNGVQLGAAVSIPAAAPATSTNAEAFAINGFGSGARYASDLTNAIIYNRALTAAEVLSLCVNGPDLADFGASQTAAFTSDFSAGVDVFADRFGTALTGNVDGIGGEDDWLRISATATSNNRRFRKNLESFLRGTKDKSIAIKLFVPSSNVSCRGLRFVAASGATADTTVSAMQPYPFTGSAATDLAALPTLDVVTQYVIRPSSFNDISTMTQLLMTLVPASGSTSDNVDSGDLVYIKAVEVTELGITGQWNAQDAQSDTGQLFDTSGNKNHALLPAAGATIIGRPVSQPQQVRWTNTWAGTNELQYIGGVNQAILPAKAYIESIVGVITGATVEDIIIGDGSDTDRYVTITTGLAAGTTTFTLANRTTDGTNLKLTVDPDTDATMSIAWTINYRVLE